MQPSEVIENLHLDEMLLAYDIAESDAVLFVLERGKKIEHYNLAWPGGDPATTKSLGAAVARTLENLDGEAGARQPVDGHATAELSSCLFPKPVIDRIAAANRVIIVPDGDLNRLPFEMLPMPSGDGELWVDRWPAPVYGPSATIVLNRRYRPILKQETAGEQNEPLLVAVGGPVFSRRDSAPSTQPAEPEPQSGVLIAGVVPGSNAHIHGLQIGDVLLSYDGSELRAPDMLGKAIRSAASRAGMGTEAAPEVTELSVSDSAENSEVFAKLWREGRTRQVTLARGQLGIQISQLEMPAALRSYRESLLSEAERETMYACARTRDGFGALQPLPGTRVEAMAIGLAASKVGGTNAPVTILLGKDATLTKLLAAANHPRYLHFATHGIAESGMRVYESALALTAPPTLTLDDYGFLRLDDLLKNWGGKLKGTDLVVLSGCRTARGRLAAADGFVGLTWGFMYAGAESVIASLWKVDDAATALLMTRLYENLLGVHDEPRMGYASGQEMPKAEALHEAKRWLRRCTPEENRRTLKAMGFDVDSHERMLRERSSLAAHPSSTSASAVDNTATTDAAPPLKEQWPSSQPTTRDSAMPPPTVNAATREVNGTAHETDSATRESDAAAHETKSLRHEAETEAHEADAATSRSTEMARPPVRSGERADRTRRLPSEDPVPLADPFDFSNPRYWAAFILVGSPD